MPSHMRTPVKTAIGSLVVGREVGVEVDLHAIGQGVHARNEFGINGAESLGMVSDVRCEKGEERLERLILDG